MAAKEPHPVWGISSGHAVYGIKHIGVAATMLSMIVQDCVEAEDSMKTCMDSSSTFVCPCMYKRASQR